MNQYKFKIKKPNIKKYDIQKNNILDCIVYDKTEQFFPT